MQPKGFDYTGHLDKHCECDWRQFEHRPVYPRQIHFYTPSGQEKPCNFSCYYCCGILSKKEQASWEDTGLELIRNLDGVAPLHMYSGAYTEPTLNPRLVEFIRATKETGSDYGLKTNGSMLLEMEVRTDLLSTLVSLADSEQDFVSVSLDAGFASSHSKTKHVSEYQFHRVLGGLRELSGLRGDSPFPKIRISYLLNRYNDSEAEILDAIGFARQFSVDSIRFSQPLPFYGDSREHAEKTWQEAREKNEHFLELFRPHISHSTTEKPFVFYVETRQPPAFSKCAYGYFQITLSSDGYMYKCTTAADNMFKNIRLGKITSDLEKFRKAIYVNQSPDFNPSKCFDLGAYCCRAAAAVNSQAGIV